MFRPFLILPLVALLSGSHASLGADQEPFALRGYYMTFMRMPTMGLNEWKQVIDQIEEDRGNTLILWMGGAFRSKRYPITWRYNHEHRNVQNDFASALIDHAHTKNIKVLLALTPFAYDGINQYPLETPELKARQKNGEPAAYWGMHSWGYNLCPSHPESQKFMREYAREMLFEFYPQADGVLLESSDYAICYCEECGQKFFEKEFQFVQELSAELWRRKPAATVMVYPHYFSGRVVPGFNVNGAKLPFDQRWTLFFTPHSAPVDRELLQNGWKGVYWTDGPTLRTPSAIRDGARAAMTNHLIGYIPSLEPFSCIPNPAAAGAARLKPFHFDWLRDGQNPLDELLIRVNRIAYREFSQNPSLSDEEFRARLGLELFGSRAEADKADDVLALQEAYFFEGDWFVPPPLVSPGRLHERAAKENWPAAKWEPYLRRIDRLKELRTRYQQSQTPVEREIARIAALLLHRWSEAEAQAKR